MRIKNLFFGIIIVFFSVLTVFCTKISPEKSGDIFLEPALLALSSVIIPMDTIVATPISQTISITNVGLGYASNLNVTLSDSANISFSLKSNQCEGVTLESLASCSFTIIFNPKEKGSGIEKIALKYNHPNGENTSLPIDIPYEASDAENPGSDFLDWQEISTNMVSSETGEQNPTQTVKIKLIGEQGANVSNISLDPITPLSITQNDCNGRSLSAQMPTCQFVIVFTRPSTPMNGNVNIHVNYTSDGESKILSNIIAFNALYNSKLEFDSSIISPMNAIVGKPSQQAITIKNTGKGSALITSITSNPTGSALSIPFGSANTCSNQSRNVKLGPSSTCVFNLVLNTSEAVAGSAKIKVMYNNDDASSAIPLQSNDISYEVKRDADEEKKCTPVGIILPKKQQSLAVSINNETNCRYHDDQIYIHFIARSSLNLNRFIVVKNIITENDHSVAMVGEPDNVDNAIVPFFTLADVKDGGFYLQPRANESLVSARLYIGLGQPISTLKLKAIDFYDQPTDKTPWDIFEFGFDLNRTKPYGFNTSQVSSFSVPLWFDIIPYTESLANPNLPLGIKLRTDVSNSVPVYLESQKAIIDKYRQEMANGPKLFTLDFLKESDNDNNIRIRSPSEQPGLGIPAENKDYFDQNMINFFEFSAYNGLPSQGGAWPFRMCTRDPGPADAITDPRQNYRFPGCASPGSQCPNITQPQCNYNTCAGTPPDYYRDIGTCFMGYVEDKTKFKFWTYQTDTVPNASRCEGSVSYNGNTIPKTHPPAQLCELDLKDILKQHDGTLTRCVLENNCIQYVQDKTNDPNYGVFNTYFMASIMRNVSTDYEPSTGYTIWGDPKSFYKKPPYNYYAKFWHEISLEHMAYGFGYDDAGNQSTTYTPDPDTLSNLIIGVGW